PGFPSHPPALWDSCPHTTDAQFRADIRGCCFFPFSSWRAGEGDVTLKFQRNENDRSRSELFPTQRIACMKEDGVGSDPLTARAPAEAPPRAWRRRMAAIVVLVLLAAGGVYLWHTIRAGEERDQGVRLAETGCFAEAEPLLKRAWDRYPRDWEVA